MSMQDLVKIKRYVDDMKIKHAQAITRQQNLESEFVRELNALKQEYDWAQVISYQNTIDLSTETTEKEYIKWEAALQTALEQAKETLDRVVKDALQEKEQVLEEMKSILRKEGYDV